MPFSRLARTQGQEYAFRLRYETFRALLEKNIGCLTILSDLEADLNHLRPSDTRVKRPLRRMFDEALLMAQELNLLSGNRFRDIYGQMDLIREDTLEIFRNPSAYEAEPLAVPLSDDKALKVSLVGGKAWGVARLSRLFPELTPRGFVLTTSAYRKIISENNLEDRIRLLLHDVETITDQEKLAERIKTIRRWILSATLPASVSEAMIKAASGIAQGEKLLWAVRSSAVNEDGRYSFAGQFDSELCIEPDNLAAACLQVVAGRFTERAVLYRLHVGLKEVDTPMAILFMPMVDPGAAGVIYTTDPREADSDKMLVNAVEGLGDKVIKGKAKADTFLLSRGASPQVLSAVPADELVKQPYRPEYLSEQTLSALGKLAQEAAAGFGHDLDIEWAVDRQGGIHLLQARRITQVKNEEVKVAKGRKAWPVIEGGVTIFPGRAEGEVFFLSDRADPATIPKGVVLVTRDPGPEISAALPRIAALLAEGGNPIGHVATLTREFSVPAVFRMGEAVKRLTLGKTVSVNAAKRTVFEGSRWTGI
ncbi:MAG: PEP/pyruvate-binding domain-containing protein, partial [Thermodesulfobacteriota bacterium]